MNISAARGATTGAGYGLRRAEIAALATGPDRPPAEIGYTPDEHAVWATVNAALSPVWAQHAAAELLAVRGELDLPTTRLPQLSEVTALLEPRTGFGYRAVPGLVAKLDFFAALDRGMFLSTQYVRCAASPLYTPEPDVIHEVIGHAHCLAEPTLARLHRLAGAAMVRVSTDSARQFIADVFWFSAEFGVVLEGGAPKAYGAGLLSSFGELGWFSANATMRPLDVVAMATQPYDISRYQPVLFGADSLGQVLDVVGGFLADVTDDLVASHLASRPASSASEE